MQLYKECSRCSDRLSEWYNRNTKWFAVNHHNSFFINNLLVKFTCNCLIHVISYFQHFYFNLALFFKIHSFSNPCSTEQHLHKSECHNKHSCWTEACLCDQKSARSSVCNTKDHSYLYPGSYKSCGFSFSA